jgi:hypothetical protein
LSPEGGRDSAKQNFAASPRGCNIPRQFSLVGYAFINNPEVFILAGPLAFKIELKLGPWALVTPIRRDRASRRLGEPNPCPGDGAILSMASVLAVDRQMSMTLAALMSSLCQPLSERIYFH